MRFLKLIIFLILCILIVGSIRGYIYYQHDKAVARTERGNLELGLKNVSETNGAIAEKIEQIRTDILFMIIQHEYKMNKLAFNDRELEREFMYLQKILDDIIGLDRNKKQKKKRAVGSN